MGLGGAPAVVVMGSLLAGLFAGVGLAAVAGWVLYRRLTRAQEEALAAQAVEMRAREKRYSEEIRRLWKAHRSELRQLQSEGLEAFAELQRERWVQSMRFFPWERGAPEVEVEAKFVFPLLGFLGYDDEEMELRTSVQVQEGSRHSSIEADWVVRDERGRALLVVEVKAPDVALGDAVREQARSYAFRLGAPVYLLTNGAALQIYQVGVVKDQPVLTCTTSELAGHWDAVMAHAGKSSVTALRAALENQSGGSEPS